MGPEPQVHNDRGSPPCSFNTAQPQNNKQPQAFLENLMSKLYSPNLGGSTASNDSGAGSSAPAPFQSRISPPVWRPNMYGSNISSSQHDRNPTAWWRQTRAPEAASTGSEQPACLQNPAWVGQSCSSREEEDWGSGWGAVAEAPQGFSGHSSRPPRSFGQAFGHDPGLLAAQSHQQQQQQQEQHAWMMGNTGERRAPNTGWERGVGSSSMTRSSSVPSGISSFASRLPGRSGGGGRQTSSSNSSNTGGSSSSSSSSSLRPMWCFSISALVWLTMVAMGSMLWWSVVQSPSSLALLTGARLLPSRLTPADPLAASSIHQQGATVLSPFPPQLQISSKPSPAMQSQPQLAQLSSQQAQTHSQPFQQQDSGSSSSSSTPTSHSDDHYKAAAKQDEHASDTRAMEGGSREAGTIAEASSLPSLSSLSEGPAGPPPEISNVAEIAAVPVESTATKADGAQEGSSSSSSSSSRGTRRAAPSLRPRPSIFVRPNTGSGVLPRPQQANPAQPPPQLPPAAGRTSSKSQQVGHSTHVGSDGSIWTWLASALGLGSMQGGAQPGSATGSTPDGFPCTCSSSSSSSSNSRQATLAPLIQLESGLGAAAVPPQLQVVPLEELRARFDPGHDPRYIDIGSWRHSKPVSPGPIHRQQGGGLAGDSQLFVRPGMNMLTLGSHRWLVAGFSAPPQALEMASSGMEGRRKLLSAFQMASRVGLNTVRVLAFNDGHTRSYALQVMPGVLDSHVLGEGLDWIVWQARHYGLRVLLVLSSAASPVRGGMSQYVRWLDPKGTANDFYSSDTYRALYYDYMTALATRVNQFTDLAYRDDPTVLGWDIMEGARDPERRGEALQAWIPLAANFLRSMDSNHLVMLGGEGIFGPASPHETHLNPPLLHGRMPWLLHQGGDAGWGDWSTVLPPMHLSAQFAVCEGADFQRNSILSELDVSAAAVAPDAWLSCSDECKLAWTRQWLAAHMRDALRIQRPLLINAVLSHGPPSRRAALLELVISYMKDAAEQGLPVAGVIMPLHAGISANDCESSFAGYSSQVSPSCYTSSMWQLKEPEDHSALRRLRQSSISSIGPANLQQVFKDADTPPSLPADDVHVLNPACICSPAEHRETESTRVSSLLLMPLPGKNERSTRLAAEAAALRAYWHGFMGGDSLVACLQQAAESLEKKESKAGKTDLENWPAAVDLLELMGEEGTPNVQRQVGIPKASNNPSQSAGESSEIPGPQQRIEMRISGLVGKFLRAGVEAGPVELLP